MREVYFIYSVSSVTVDEALTLPNFGGGRPKAARRPLLSNRSPSLAIISFAVCWIRGSCDSFRIMGTNFAGSVSPPCAPRSSRMLENRRIAGVGSGKTSCKSSPALLRMASKPSSLLCRTSERDRKARTAATSSLMAKALVASSRYRPLSAPKLSAASTICWESSESRRSPSSVIR